jgi:hypothetical protein
VFPNQIPAKLKIISPIESVDSQIGFAKKNKTIKIKNAQIVKEMKKEDIEGSDLYEFLTDVKDFFNRNGS